MFQTGNNSNMILGIEPGPPACQADVLTTTLSAPLLCACVCVCVCL